MTSRETPVSAPKGTFWHLGDTVFYDSVAVLRLYSDEVVRFDDLDLAYDKKGNTQLPLGSWIVEKYSHIRRDSERILKGYQENQSKKDTLNNFSRWLGENFRKGA